MEKFPFYTGKSILSLPWAPRDAGAALQLGMQHREAAAAPQSRGDSAGQMCLGTAYKIVSPCKKSI